MTRKTLPKKFDDPEMYSSPGWTSISDCSFIHILSIIVLILVKKLMLTHRKVLDIYKKYHILREVNEPFLERSLSGNLLKVR